MLVCNVSLRPPRAGITADISESVEAADATATGQVVFATLVDDPASVGDLVDAYLGEIMVEAASADVVVDANIPATYTVAIDEAAAAADVPDASSAPAFATLDGVATAVTLSGGNLIATHNANTSVDGARSATIHSTGKYYFEVTAGLVRNGDSVAVLLSTESYNNLNNKFGAYTGVFGNGAIWLTGATNTGKNIGSWAGGGGDVIGAAVDLTARLAWFRRNAGNWNNDATANPATGIGGVAVDPTGSFGPALGFTGLIGDSMTANFGQTTYAHAAPSGFGNW